MRNKVKGFTLIELIVVMAIFSIILFGAMQFMPTVSKIMAFSDVQQEGSAAVSSISTYLENELSPVEYIDVYNSIDTANMNSRVRTFAEAYYEGVLRQDSTADPGTAKWADGKIHAITIDNSATGRGKITHYTYDCNFKPGAISVSGGVDQEWAVNAAYYDSYTYLIRIGAFSDPTVFADTEVTYEDLSQNMTSEKTQFTILAETTRGTANPKTYSYTTVASLSLVNILAMQQNGSTYYVINEGMNAAASDNTICNITDDAQPQRRIDPTLLYARYYGKLATTSRLLYAPPTDPSAVESYTFVYSYASEIDTSKQ